MMEKETELWDCVIIGAGISGLLAASALTAAGKRVVVLEKGRGFGGRMATRRRGEASWDHGAQFFTVREPLFQKHVDAWLEAGCVEVWHQTVEGHPRYRALPSMTGVAKFLAAELDVRREHLVEKLNWGDSCWELVCANGESFSGSHLLITAPVPQANVLIEGSNIALKEAERNVLKGIHFDPSIALLVTLDGPSGMEEPGMLKFAGDSPLQTITDNALKGLSAVPALTIHSSYQFAHENLEDLSEATAERLWQAAKPYVQSNAIEKQLHRWRYAHCPVEFADDFFAASDYPLWLAGDGLGGPKVEGAALSGLKVAQAILASW